MVRRRAYSAPVPATHNAKAPGGVELLDYWITSVACARIDGGIVTPRIRAVFRLTTRSNFVGCSIGRSPGLAPFRILSTWVAARRYESTRSGPKDKSPPAFGSSLKSVTVGRRYCRVRS